MFYSKRRIPLVAHIPCWLALLILAISLNFQHAFAQDEVVADQLAESPQERDRAAREGQRIYRSRITPNWIQGTDNFWYRNDLPGGAREFVFVDVALGKRQLAFDHQEVAKALGKGIQPTHLPIERLDFDSTNQTWLLFGKGTSYRWDSRNNALSETNDVTRDVALEATNAGDRRNGRRPSGMESSITFENRSGSSVEIFWLNGEGGKQSYGKIEPGASRDQHTFGGHRWQVVNAKGEVLGEVAAQDNHSTLVLDGRPIPSEAPVRTRVPRTSGRERDGTSPDGKWILSQRQHNLYLQAASSEDRRPLSKDGMEGDTYSHWHWSPDSRFVIAFRMKSVEKKPVHWIRSSPEGGGRAILESRPYVLPGDPFPTYELNLFRVDSGEQIKPAVDRFEHEWARPQVRFAKDGKSFTYQQTDRGHQRFRLIEIQTEDGRVRNIIDERTDTFIWTAHTENQKLPIVQWLDNSDELIFATEKNGWRQLLLIDRTTGNELRALTPQGIVVRSIESVDEANRLLWFTACGRDGQDPYLIHYGYVSLDTGKLTWLTEGDGHHTVQFSPSKRFMVDTYSRVDMAPVTELRRVSDGSKVCDLESSDVSELAASQWKPPEVFVAKGRDGKTDIWGIICRPKDFDPNKKYPVIEDIYAGPQGSFVPRRSVLPFVTTR